MKSFDSICRSPAAPKRSEGGSFVIRHPAIWISDLALAATLVCFTGCSVGPNYHRPSALGSQPVPATFGDASITNEQWKVAEPSAQLSRGEWWNIYHDPELDRLETLAVTNNQQIATAVANFDEARAAVKTAQAGFFPQISAAPSATRQRTSANTSVGGLKGVTRTFNTFLVQADASWELDLWGRVRRLAESARAQMAASADDLAGEQLSIQAEVAMDYFTLRTLDEQSALLMRTTAAYDHALELTQNRKRSGVADAQDVALAETQLKSVRAQVAATDLQRAQTRHALAVLCGQAATTFALMSGATNLPTVPAIPPAVPSEWLEHRPDIAAAERHMAAANANVGVAKAAFYPRVLLNGSGGFESISTSTLFDWPSRIWAVGPTLQLPLFTGGQNLAQLQSAKAAYDGSVADYRQTVLTAFQDVEDQLAAQNYLTSQLDEETDALASAHRALDIALQRYKAGVEQYLDVITSQTLELTQEESVNQLRGQRLATSVSLIKALGAGWSAAK